MIHPIEQQKLLLKLILPALHDFIQPILLPQLAKFRILKRIKLESPREFVLHIRQRIDFGHYPLFPTHLKCIPLFQPFTARPDRAHHHHHRNSHHSISHKISYHPISSCVWAKLTPSIPSPKKTPPPTQTPCSNTRTSAAYSAPKSPPPQSQSGSSSPPAHTSGAASCVSPTPSSTPRP